MANHAGVSAEMVRRIWVAHGLKAHLVRTFKVSTDPEFVAKLRDVVGLYLNPPERAIVFSVDEKSQIQALDRTQPSLPMKPGRAGTMTHDYRRNGLATLFAALNVADGHGDRPPQAQAPPPGVPRVLEGARRQDAQASGPAPDRGQLPHAQAPGGQRVAQGPSSELIAAINDYVRQTNADPKPFVWTAKANDILKKVAKCRATLEAAH
jgi:hypothetical protein